MGEPDYANHAWLGAKLASERTATLPAIRSSSPHYGSYQYPYTWAAACGMYGNSGDFPGYLTVALATENGSRGAALSITSDTLQSGGQLAFIDAERLLACRMRFGRIGR